MNDAPVVKDICLVGGGHSHALLLRRWAMHPIAGVRLTLISSTAQTPYSGMLPGLIAGHYSFDDIHIDLRRLCSWANVRFVEDTVISLNLDKRQVQFAERPSIAFDVLSLDTGSTPDLSVPGSASYVTPVKPVSNFNARWQRIEQRLKVAGDASDVGVSIGVVGSGAGGFELISAMQNRLRDTTAECLWFLRGDSPISGRPARVGQFAMEAAQAAGIRIIKQFDVACVEAGKLIAADGREAQLDEIVWCTAATGPDWPETAGLATDKRGFVATNAHLQSLSHPFVFATGDIGTQMHTPSDKAGVFAVRQAPVLFSNLRLFLLNQALETYTPQKDFLSLMATGPKHGIASRGPVVVRGDWVWRWKDHIDQTFMEKFRQLPKLAMNASLAKLPNALAAQYPSEGSAMRCKACGAKVGNDALQRVLADLCPGSIDHATSIEFSPAADAAIANLPSRRLVQSVDQINAIVDDPWLLGRIATLHAISDVHTLHAELHSAQVLLSLPEASEIIVERDLRLMMSGVLSAMSEESCSLIGGHTTQGVEMSVGLVVNATIAEEATSAPASDFTARKVKPGDCLILTKALGIGTLFAAQMQTMAYGPHITQAIDAMLKTNRIASNILQDHGVHAMTDVTGFGLLGHLQNLLRGLHVPSRANQAGDASELTSASAPGASILLDKIPLLSGAYELSKAGIKSTLFEKNRSVFDQCNIEAACDPAALHLLADPQTSGGLLAIVPAAATPACVEKLNNAGYEASAVIGTITNSGMIEVSATNQIE